MIEFYHLKSKWIRKIILGRRLFQILQKKMRKGTFLKEQLERKRDMFKILGIFMRDNKEVKILHVSI